MKNKAYQFSKYAIAGRLFVAPFFIFYTCFGLFPILFSAYISLTNWEGLKSPTFIGFDNYVRIFTTDPYFYKSVLNTFIILLMYFPLLGIISLLIAYGLNSSLLHNKVRRFCQTVNFLPYITTTVAIGVLFALLFDTTTGYVNLVLEGLGIIDEAVKWLSWPWTARFVVALARFWRGLGYWVVIYMAGMTSIPHELYEAARIDGANENNVFLRITLPLLKPTILFLVVTSLTQGLRMVEEPMLLLSGWVSGTATVGGPNRSCLTAIWNMYDTAYGTTFLYGKASAIAYGLFIIIALISFLNFKLINSKKDDY